MRKKGELNRWRAAEARYNLGKVDKDPGRSFKRLSLSLQLCSGKIIT